MSIQHKCWIRDTHANTPKPIYPKSLPCETVILLSSVLIPMWMLLFKECLKSLYRTASAPDFMPYKFGPLLSGFSFLISNSILTRERFTNTREENTKYTQWHQVQEYPVCAPKAFERLTCRYILGIDTSAQLLPRYNELKRSSLQQTMEDIPERPGGPLDDLQSIYTHNGFLCSYETLLFKKSNTHDDTPLLRELSLLSGTILSFTQHLAYLFWLDQQLSLGGCQWITQLVFIESLTCALTHERWWRPGQAPCPHWWYNFGTYYTFHWWEQTLLREQFQVLVQRACIQIPDHFLRLQNVPHSLSFIG